MNKQDFLKLVAADYAPDLVCIDGAAMLATPLAAGNCALVSTDFPFDATPRQGLNDCPVVFAAARYLLAMTALQFRFWAVGGQGEFLRYDYEGKVGSTGLAYAFGRAWGDTLEPSESLTEAAQTLVAVERAFGATIPGVEQRRDVLAEVLSGEAQGLVDFVLRYIAERGRVDVTLAYHVSRRLPTAYGDVYLKKAMLFLGFLASYLKASGAMPQVTEDLCAYADYQVPNVMRHFGILRYSDELAERIARRELLPKGGREERAIRAATVLGAEAFAKMHRVTAAEFDWWCFQQRKVPVTPFHLTDTTDY